MARISNYNTKQRDLILEFLKQSQGEHVTADMILEYLAENGTPVGKATVYRYLDLLEKQEMVRKYQTDERRKACYQYVEDMATCRCHYHLKCLNCGKLFHITCNELDHVAEHMLKEHGFLVDESRTVYYGVCAKCRGLEGAEEECACQEGQEHHCHCEEHTHGDDNHETCQNHH